MFGKIKTIRTALQCAYLVVCVIGAAKMFINLDRMCKKNETERLKKNQKEEIVIEFID